MCPYAPPSLIKPSPKKFSFSLFLIHNPICGPLISLGTSLPPTDNVYQRDTDGHYGQLLKPNVTDSDGNIDTNTIRSASYVLPAGDIGTSVKLKSVQIISLNNGAGVTDEGNLSAEEASDLFGKTNGYKASDPAPQVDSAPCSVEDEDF